MGKQYAKLNNNDIEFIKQQKLFYIASCSNHEVNLSPRGYDSLHVEDANTLYMMDYLGSGNRTARDIGEDGEVTLVFNSYEGAPKILRCFCKGEVILKNNDKFNVISKNFNVDMNGIRQMFIFKLYAVETSCGAGVPLMDYKEERSGVRDFALKQHEVGKFDKYEEGHRVPPSLEF